MFPNLNTGALNIDATFSEAVELASRHGFKGVDFSIEQVRDLVDDEGIDHVRSLMTDAGVGLGAWGLPVNWREAVAAFEKDLNALPPLADLADGLGCHRTLTVIMPGHNDRNYDENWQVHIERLRQISETLAQYNCRLGLEFVGPRTLKDTFRHPFIYTMDGALEMANEIGTGNVGLLLDLFHLYTSHGSVSEVSELDNHDVVAVHVNDALPNRSVDEQMDLERALPGETDVTDVVSFLKGLDAIGYGGPVTTEPFSKRLEQQAPSQRVAETAAAMREVWQATGLSWPA